MEALPPAALEILEPLPASAPVLLTPEYQISKQAIRTSLKASTLDGIFAAIFSSITGGVLLTKFLLELGASPVEIGMISSIPMLVNLLQPLGAYFADRTTSRRLYVLWLFVPARLLWLILVLEIGWISWSTTDPHRLVSWTLAMVFASNILAALGSASWLCWMAVLVPQRLRGRYFGFRNSATSLATLICVPLLGFTVSAWPSGTVEGYGVALFLGVVAGLVSLGCQFFMADVNPQRPTSAALSRSGAFRREMGSRGAGEHGSMGDGERIDIGSQESLCPRQSHASFLNGGNPRTELAPQRGEPPHGAGSPAPLPLCPSAFSAPPASFLVSILKDSNFLAFLLYFGLWTFSVNLSAPFFNLYLLDNLHLDLSSVTIYSSMHVGANIVMLVLWGKLADRLGNRPLLLLMGILVAVIPLLWLGASTDRVSLWVWLPLIHIFRGGTWAAIDLCSSNIQMEVAPNKLTSTYFAIAAAVAGVSGALGTTAGSFLAGLSYVGGLPGVFALSTVVRFVALIPLIFVREPRSQPVFDMMRNFLRFLPRFKIEVRTTADKGVGITNPQ